MTCCRSNRSPWQGGDGGCGTTGAVNAVARDDGVIARVRLRALRDGIMERLYFLASSSGSCDEQQLGWICITGEEQALGMLWPFPSLHL